MPNITRYVLLDILKSRFALLYALLLFCISTGIFMMDGDSGKSMVSLLSIVLIIVPLVSIIYTTTYFYNASEFITLLMAQPMSRKNIYLGIYAGILLSLIITFIVGAGIPIIMFAADYTGFTLIIAGILLTAAFVSLAIYASVVTRDKARGIGVSLMVWFFFTIVYDALVLLMLFLYSEYPLETTVIILAALNPVDLSRILILLQLDISALMGFTGALYKEFFGSLTGISLVMFFELAWVIVPAWLGFRIFKSKNW